MNEFSEEVLTDMDEILREMQIDDHIDTIFYKLDTIRGVISRAKANKALSDVYYNILSVLCDRIEAETRKTKELIEEVI